MKRKLLLGLAFVLLVILSGYVVYKTSTVGSGRIVRIYTGYLVCQSCAGAAHGMALDGVNVLKNPEKHSVGCLRMPSCIASGFGIFLKKQDGNYTYYKFNKEGSDLAYNNIVSKTTKADNLLVEVTGKMKSGIIVVNNITEK
jgi:hypothetical protein